MREHDVFSQGVSEITATDRERLESLRPEGFQASEFKEMHLGDIESLRNELKQLKQAIQTIYGTETPLKSEDTTLFKLEAAPLDPLAIYPLAMQKKNILLHYSLDNAARLPTESFPQTTTLGPSDVQRYRGVYRVHASSKQNVERLRTLHEKAVTENFLGIFIRNAVDNAGGNMYLQAADLDPDREAEHARNFEPAISADVYQDMIYSGHMARFLLTQQVISQDETDALLAVAHNESELLRGKFVQATANAIDIPAAHLENAYAAYSLRKKGIKPFTIHELRAMLAEVYELVMHENPDL